MPVMRQYHKGQRGPQIIRPYGIMDRSDYPGLRLGLPFAFAAAFLMPIASYA